MNRLQTHKPPESPRLARADTEEDWERRYACMLESPTALAAQYNALFSPASFDASAAAFGSSSSAQQPANGSGGGSHGSHDLLLLASQPSLGSPDFSRHLNMAGGAFDAALEQQQQQQQRAHSGSGSHNGGSHNNHHRHGLLPELLLQLPDTPTAQAANSAAAQVAPLPLPRQQLPAAVSLMPPPPPVRVHTPPAAPAMLQQQPPPPAQAQQQPHAATAVLPPATPAAHAHTHTQQPVQRQLLHDALPQQLQQQQPAPAAAPEQQTQAQEEQQRAAAVPASAAASARAADAAALPAAQQGAAADGWRRPVDNLVWVRVPRYPHWPALMLTADEAAAASATVGDGSGGASVLVRYFGTHDAGWVSVNQISGWDVQRAERSAKTKAAVFVRSLREANAFHATGELPEAFASPPQLTPPASQPPAGSSHKSKAKQALGAAAAAAADGKAPAAAQAGRKGGGPKRSASSVGLRPRDGGSGSAHKASKRARQVL